MLLTIAAVLFYVIEVAQISFTETETPAKTATPVQPSTQKEHKTQKKSEAVAQLEIPVLEKQQ